MIYDNIYYYKERSLPLKKYMPLLLIFLFTVLIVPVRAADNEPPQLLYKNIHPTTVAFEGNTTAGYTTIEIKTNEPTRGYISVTGNLGSTKINLSTTEYKSDFIVHWVPWDDQKREPLPPGEYTLKLYLTDQGYNQMAGYPLGKLTVVSEPNPKKLIDFVTATPSTISPKYLVTNPLTLIEYRVNRHAEVEVIIQKSGTDYYHDPKQKLEPGLYQFSWNGRDNDGKIVPDGDYNLLFKTTELNFNNPSNTPTEYRLGKITVKDGEYGIPTWRLEEIIAEGSFDQPEFSPNGDGVQDTVTGTISLKEKANIDVWITNAAGAHIKKVLSGEFDIGNHIFSWDGTEFYDGTVPNGPYSIKLTVFENGAYGYLPIENSQVRVTGGHEITVPEPVQEVQVVTDTTPISVYPMGQGYTGKKGDIYPIIRTRTDNISYEVLVKEGVTGTLNPADVELINLESIPLQWGKITKETTVYKGPGIINKVITKIPENTVVRILRKDSSWYRVLLDSGEQAYVSENDLIVVEQNQEQGIKYIVANGDTLWKIAQKYNVTIDQLIQANNLDFNNYIYPGQILTIPVSNSTTNPNDGKENMTVYIVESGNTLWKIANKYGITIQDLVNVNNLDPNQYLYIGQKLFIPTQTIVYAVQSEDTLWKISNKFNVSIQDIVEKNNLDINGYLYIGQKLMIPSFDQYTVQAGDTLWKIAQKYNTTVENLIQWNMLNPNDYLYIGQKLKVRG